MKFAIINNCKDAASAANRNLNATLINRVTAILSAFGIDSDTYNYQALQLVAQDDCTLPVDETIYDGCVFCNATSDSNYTYERSFMNTEHPWPVLMWLQSGWGNTTVGGYQIRTGVADDQGGLSSSSLGVDCEYTVGAASGRVAMLGQYYRLSIIPETAEYLTEIITNTDDGHPLFWQCVSPSGQGVLYCVMFNTVGYYLGIATYLGQLGITVPNPIRLFTDLDDVDDQPADSHCADWAAYLAQEGGHCVMAFSEDNPALESTLNALYAGRSVLPMIPHTDNHQIWFANNSPYDTAEKKKTAYLAWLEEKQSSDSRLAHMQAHAGGYILCPSNRATPLSVYAMSLCGIDICREITDPGMSTTGSDVRTSIAVDGEMKQFRVAIAKPFTNVTGTYRHRPGIVPNPGVDDSVVMWFTTLHVSTSYPDCAGGVIALPASDGTTNKYCIIYVDTDGVAHAAADPSGFPATPVGTLLYAKITRSGARVRGADIADQRAPDNNFNCPLTWSCFHGKGDWLDFWQYYQTQTVEYHVRYGYALWLGHGPGLSMARDGHVTFKANVTEGQTVTIGTNVYEFRSGTSGYGGDNIPVYYGATPTPAVCSAALEAVINDNDDSGLIATQVAPNIYANLGYYIVEIYGEFVETLPIIIETTAPRTTLLVMDVAERQILLEFIKQLYEPIRDLIGAQNCRMGTLFERRELMGC